jgi:Kdo2-lipid IVA lauroyltransferase/acyltransferase
MRYIHYRILFGLLRIVGHLPLKFLYFLSDCLFPILYYFIPYRKKLVIGNLRNSFPGWDEQMILKTTRKFYHYFYDLLIESFAGNFMSKEELCKRFVLRNPEVCNDLYDKGKSISLVMSHYGNWEWSSVIPLFLKHKSLAIYKPLNNKYIDGLIKKLRERFGVLTIPMEKIFRSLIDYKNRNIPTITFFLADQRPLRTHIHYWLKFMNQDTPVVLGPEKISGKFDMAVVYFNVIPVKRGYYEAEFLLIFEDVKHSETYEVTTKYYEILEKIIREKPEYWLWTHHRWKHKR